MSHEELVQQLMEDFRRQYDEAKRRMEGVENILTYLESVSSHIVVDESFRREPPRLSSASWLERAEEMIQELIKVSPDSFPTKRSVLKTVYKRLRDVYGIVLEQTRRDYKNDINTLRYTTTLEAISGDDKVRDIFDSILTDLFPSKYFSDDILDELNTDPAELSETENEVANQTVGVRAEEMLYKIILPLAEKRKDTSFCYSETFNLVCDNMDCAWSNLKKRSMKRNGLDYLPGEVIVLSENPNVLRKFKKTVKTLLAE